MSSAKGLLLSAIGRIVLRDARVSSVREVADHLREIRLEGPALRDVAWTPGDKIQVLLPSRDVRTYTPASWDTERGATDSIVFDHGDSPGASWSRRVQVGEACRFVGPQRSLRRDTDRPAVLFGDETSYAVAVALVRSAPRAPLACVFEVGSRAAAEPAIAALGLAATWEVSLVERSASGDHLAEIATQIERLLRERASAELLLTGRAQSIQELQRRLRTAGVRGPRANKAYWAVGKTGLD